MKRIVGVKRWALLLLALVSTNQAQQSKTELTKDDKFIQACMQGNLSTVKLFVESGLHPDSAQWNKLTGLMLAARFRQLSVASYLVTKGADVHRKVSYQTGFSSVRYPVSEVMGGTPLTEASFSGDTAMVNLLLRQGAKVDEENSLRSTALLYAAQSGSLDLVRALMKKGADVNHVNIIFENPLSVAVRKNQKAVVEYLMQNTQVKPATIVGALVAAIDSNRLDLAKFILSRSNAADSLSMRNSNYPLTPLMIAASQGNLAFAELLLQHGANGNRVVHSDHTPLTEAMNGPSHDVMVRFLLKNGASVNPILRDYHQVWYKPLTQKDLKTMNLMFDAGLDRKAFADMLRMGMLFTCDSALFMPLFAKTMQALQIQGDSVAALVEQEVKKAQRKRISIQTNIVQLKKAGIALLPNSLALAEAPASAIKDSPILRYAMSGALDSMQLWLGPPDLRNLFRDVRIQETFQGNNALSVAIANRQEQCIRFLIENGATLPWDSQLERLSPGQIFSEHVNSGRLDLGIAQMPLSLALEMAGFPDLAWTELKSYQEPNFILPVAFSIAIAKGQAPLAHQIMERFPGISPPLFATDSLEGNSLGSLAFFYAAEYCQVDALREMVHSTQPEFGWKEWIRNAYPYARLYDCRAVERFLTELYWGASIPYKY